MGRLGKRATSPLVATFVVLIFALTVGFIIVTFDSTPSIASPQCMGVEKVQVVYIKNMPRICQKPALLPGDQPVLSILLENKGKRDVDGLQVTLFGNSTTGENIHVIRDYDAKLVAGNAISKQYKFPSSIGWVEQARISFYKKQTDYVLCDANTIVVDMIPECTI
jgi:hypothetical protein